MQNKLKYFLQGNFEDFLELFEKDLLMYGSYFHHVLGGWALKDHPNMKFMWYEDMKTDIRKEISNICEFVDHKLSPEKMEELLDHVSFNSMKKNPAVNIPRSDKNRGDFIRKGVIGDSKNYFSQERDQKWNEWIDRKLEDSTLKMPGI